MVDGEAEALQYKISRRLMKEAKALFHHKRRKKILSSRKVSHYIRRELASP